jgi:hypothetical protein
LNCGVNPHFISKLARCQAQRRKYVFGHIHYKCVVGFSSGLGNEQR